MTNLVREAVPNCHEHERKRQAELVARCGPSKRRRRSGAAADHGGGIHRVPRHRDRDSGATASCAPGAWSRHVSRRARRRQPVRRCDLSRVWAGRHSDTKGAKHAVVVGLMIGSAAGLLYLLSLGFAAKPAVSVTILLTGRGLLGVGESFIITGAQNWGLAKLGIQNTSKVLAWVGSAMFS